MLDMAVTAFLQLNFVKPLLCLTVSMTLREKPLPMNQLKHPLRILLAGQSSLPTEPSPSSIKPPEHDITNQGEDSTGLKEINLLQGLFAGKYVFLGMLLQTQYTN